MVAYRFAEHGGEVELELEAETVEGIFASALEAFAELVSTDGGGAALERRIELDGDDRALLLVDWLSELVYLAEVDRFVPDRIVAFELAGDHLRATVAGRRDQPLQLVKAVTLSSLELAQEGAVWHGRVVLDV
ncbi:MAG TPA: archease [Gaiellaceae bacterium]|jgi:SHS2 domain-containing protein